MENLNFKESYLQRRMEQLQQWDRVMEKLKSRAKKAKDKSSIDLHNHIGIIQAKKENTVNKLLQLKEAEIEKWDDFKASLEESWVDLRKAFLKASERPQNK